MYGVAALGCILGIGTKCKCDARQEVTCIENRVYLIFNRVAVRVAELVHQSCEGGKQVLSPRTTFFFEMYTVIALLQLQLAACDSVASFKGKTTTGQVRYNLCGLTNMCTIKR